MAKTKQTEIENTVVTDEIVATPPSEHTADNATIRPKSSFGKTMYYIDLSRERLVKGPGQLLGIIKYMIDHDITSAENAMQGAEIGRLAVASGYVTTAKLTGEVIFAYYIRRMEREFGIEHAATIHAKTGKRMN